MRWLARAGAGTAALLVLASAGASRGSAGDPPPPPPRNKELPELESARFSAKDAAASFAAFEMSDLVRADGTIDGNDLVLQAEMKKPLDDGIFTRIEYEFDCDGMRNDVEVAVKSAVGSRFRPTAYVPPPGFPAPMELVRTSWASTFDEPSLAARRRMTIHGTIRGTAAGGRRLRTRVPLALLWDRGARSSTSGVFVRATAETSCSEHPIVFDYDALDAGRAITVDGKGDEWSGGPYVTDATGELPVWIGHADLLAVWCEHSADAVFVRVDFARPGFGAVRSGDGDVSVRDELVVRLEPRGDAYMDAVEATIPATSATGIGAGTRWVAAPGTGTVEVVLARSPKQTRFRVLVWSDVRRYDQLAGPWLPLPLEAPK